MKYHEQYELMRDLLLEQLREHVSSDILAQLAEAPDDDLEVLPPVPESVGMFLAVNEMPVDGYSADQLSEYAREAIAPHKRKNLELSRVYAERGHQIDRLDIALERSTNNIAVLAVESQRTYTRAEMETFARHVLDARTEREATSPQVVLTEGIDTPQMRKLFMYLNLASAGDNIERVSNEILYHFNTWHLAQIASIQAQSLEQEEVVFTIEDNDLDLLLNLSVELVSGRGNMDLGLYWHDTLQKVLARLNKQ